MRVRMFPIGLGKIILHAASRPDTEVAGLLIGKESRKVLEVWDAETGPQEGGRGYVRLSEEFIAATVEKLHSSKSELYIVGWYHSHPGFGVFLSQIDVQTQLNYQAMYPKAIALVIDPSEYVITRKISDVSFKVYQVNETRGVVELPVQIGLARGKLLESTISGLRDYQEGLTRFSGVPHLLVSKTIHSLSTMRRKLWGVNNR
ncbi:MAG: Mov34/MPN/PAD-1 family protein [Aigarchaeota archaeon]|nr:Mov34/MPN/PAD-1 family protein [Aigarchaeota archaeon]MDW8092497.1 Mov34/MPN/PAD-1 family protein [Nitrososphaerota archaeon]